MVKEAVQQLGGECSYPAIKAKIRSIFGEGVNESSVTCSIISGSVNHPSRIHYNENKKPRVSDTEYDFLFNTGRGKVVWHEPEKHGVWEIVEAADGCLDVRMVEGVGEDAGPEAEGADTNADSHGVFALEAHLRDYLARNLPKLDGVPAPLQLYKAKDRDGVEFQTDVGPMDILAKAGEDFYVFELKLARGPDSALGQILRYMGWVKTHLAGSNKVYGVIVASDISKKLKYAATQVPNIRLMEYQLKVDLHPVGLVESPRPL